MTARPPTIRAFAQIIRQESLLLTEPGLAGAQGGQENAPRVVFVGIGLCGRHGPSEAPPFDALGVLLAAGAAAKALNVPLIALIADAHADIVGMRSLAVEARTREWNDILARLRAWPLFRSLIVMRARQLHRTGSHRSALNAAKRIAPGDASDYCVAQLADVLCMRQEWGPLLKVGWALRSRAAWSCSDEMGFDLPLRAARMTGLSFAYTKPGRAFDDIRSRAVPYVTVDPSARLLLRSDEDPVAKLATASANVTAQTIAGVRKHLKAITRLWSRTVAPLEGGLEQRLQTVYGQLFKPAAGDAVVDDVQERSKGRG